MKLGIKVGPNKFKKEIFGKIEKTNPQVVEIWYSPTIGFDYAPLFNYLKKKKTDVGLHFWASLPNKTYYNIAYPNKEVLDFSLSRIKETINIANKNNFQYVNIHPGARALAKVDFKKGRFSLISKPVDLNSSINTFLENAMKLNDYAKNKGIVFTIETVPPRVPTAWLDREHSKPQNIYELPLEAILKAAGSGLFIANDFEHTAANAVLSGPVLSAVEGVEGRQQIYKFLYDTTLTLLPQTRLIHLGFLLPPFDGTDTHDTMENPLFDSPKAVPNKNQTIELLKLFKDKDVWLIPEPKTHHVENYLIAKTLI